MVKGWLKKLLAPAEDPRKTYSPAQERPQELLQKVSRARVNLAAIKSQLLAKIAQAKQKHERLQSQGTQDPFALQIQEIVAQEVKGLEQEVAELEQEERELALIEQRLATQVEALSARQEALEARYRATETRVQVRRELEGLSGELAEVGVALEKAEQRSEDVQARASALEHFAGLGAIGAGTAFRNPAAQQLANRYAAGAALEQPEALKRQLGQGFKMLLELEYEYGQLQSALMRRKETDPLAITYIPPLADETYQQGISVLRDGLELVEAVRSPGEEKLTAEMRELEGEIEALKREGTDVALTKARFREEKLISHQQRLEIIQRQYLRVDELLHQAGRCVATLNQARLELAALKAEGAGTSIGAVTETLEKTIKEAREVQEELKRLGL